MLEETPDDRANRDVLRHPGHAGAQRAHSAHDQLDLHPGTRSAVEGLDRPLVDQRIHLGDHPGRAAGARVLGLAGELRQHHLVHAERRLGEAVELRRLGEARELQEQLVHVVADVVRAGEQAVVGVLARGAGVIVTGAEMTVAADTARLAPHDECQLGVCFVPDHPVHDVRADFLQPVGELDVRLLVEACAQLDDHGHVLAGIGRGHERIDQRRIVAGAVERLLDGQHLRVGRRLPQEVHHRRKALVGMVEQDVFLAYAGEEIGAAHQALRNPRGEDRIFEIRALHEVVHRRQPIQVHGPRHRVGVESIRGELRLEELHHVLGTVVGDLQPYGRAVAAMRELALERAPQVVDFLVVDEQIAVAGDAELVAAHHLDAGEELVNERLHDRREQHAGTGRPRTGQRHDAWQRARRLHDGELAVAIERILALEPYDEVQALVLNARKGPCRVETERGEHRLDLTLEVLLEPIGLLAGPVRAPEERHALRGELGQEQLIQAAILVGDQLGRAVMDRGELLRDRHGIGG